jgi:hypothetical protein
VSATLVAERRAALEAAGDVAKGATLAAAAGLYKLEFSCDPHLEKAPGFNP